MSLDLPEIRSSMSFENIEEVSSNENQNLDQTVLANETIKEETLSYEIDVQSENEKGTKYFFDGLKNECFSYPVRKLTVPAEYPKILVRLYIENISIF